LLLREAVDEEELIVNGFIALPLLDPLIVRPL
jgi:hypothetical protein